jgi:phage terminase large subunit-like protein
MSPPRRSKRLVEAVQSGALRPIPAGRAGSIYERRGADAGPVPVAVPRVVAPRVGRSDVSVPPWRAWRTTSRAARCIRFIETYCRAPSGAGAGERIKLAPFQRDELEELLAPGVRSGGVQIPRGNGKSTLWAAVGLWAVADFPDAPQVPLVAFNGLQAMRTLFKPAARMVSLEPELSSRMTTYTANTDRLIKSWWNSGELLALPANVERLQGLNPSVALVDEAQTIPPEVLYAVQQGAGKRPESLVLAIGTPAPDAQRSALFDLRERVHGGARIQWVEYAAEAGCALDDRAQWALANPGIGAGFLFADVLELECGAIPEPEFRLYRLGQWIDTAQAGWLPVGAWDACPLAEPPPDGTEVVLALAGTWMSSIALVGATLDGAVFLAWFAESADDGELEDVLSSAWLRWQVTELVVAPRIRAGLVARLCDGGMPVEVWPHRTDLDAASSADFRAAITERRIAHDHHPVMAEHIGALVGQAGPDGTLRLASPDDGRPTDAGRAARMAWWRAVEQSQHPAPAIY